MPKSCGRKKAGYTVLTLTFQARMAANTCRVEGLMCGHVHSRWCSRSGSVGKPGWPQPGHCSEGVQTDDQRQRRLKVPFCQLRAQREQLAVTAKKGCWWAHQPHEPGVPARKKGYRSAKHRRDGRQGSRAHSACAAPHNPSSVMAALPVLCPSGLPALPVGVRERRGVII